MLREKIGLGECKREGRRKEIGIGERRGETGGIEEGKEEGGGY